MGTTTRSTMRQSSSSAKPRSGSRRFVGRLVVIGLTVLLVFLYASLLYHMMFHFPVAPSSASSDQQRDVVLSPHSIGQPLLFQSSSSSNQTSVLETNQKRVQALLSSGNNQESYDGWRELVVELAALPSDQLLQILQTLDPFGVRTFEAQLQDMESSREAILQYSDIEALFPCPEQRVTLPDVRNHSRATWYRQQLRHQERLNQGNDHSQNEEEEEDGHFTYLFFQHLRKAGGTNFCALAENNLDKAHVPSYYCMPDMYWNKKRCAGCFLSYENEEIQRRMQKDGHLIMGNEWDAFDERFLELSAIFATSFRRPLDRALSQFRFECIEERGCKIKNVTVWWEKRRDLANVYTWTFSRQPVGRHQMDVDGLTPMEQQQRIHRRQKTVGKALDMVRHFNLVLVMEWLAYAGDHTKDVLGFQDLRTMTERVRPHINQAKREDGQTENKMGAAGIAKASWTPQNYLSPAQYKRMSEDLALDELLTDAARRMFLERVVCPDMKEPTPQTSTA